MVVEPGGEYGRHRMSQGDHAGRRRYAVAVARAAARVGASATATQGVGLREPPLDLFDEGTVGRPLRVPQTGGGVHRGGHAQPFQFIPQRLVVGVSEIPSFHEHGADECAAETSDSGGASQLRQGEVHVPEGDHGGSEEAVRRCLAEVCNPVVVCPRQGVGYVRVFDQVETFGEPRGVKEGLVDTHGVHVPEPRPRVPRAFTHWMADVRVQFADGVPGHSGLPDGVSGDVGVAAVPKHLAVDFQVRVKPSFFAPEGVFAQDPVLGFQVFLPQLPGLHDVGVAVENLEVFPGGHRSRSNGFPVTSASPRIPA